jgi:hypothetical protein
MGQHFCGVHKFTKHPGALEEGRVFVCKTDVVVCSRVYGMAVAYSLNEAHVVEHCERVGATAGMRTSLPFDLMPTSKDAELRSIVPRATPEKTSTALTAGGQDEYGKVMFGSASGKDGSFGSEGSDGRDHDGSTTSKEETDLEGGPFKGLRIEPAAGEGPRMEVDYGKGSASSQKAKQRSKERRKPKHRRLGRDG